jgi:hypothetical protein
VVERLLARRERISGSGARWGPVVRPTGEKLVLAPARKNARAQPPDSTDWAPPFRPATRTIRRQLEAPPEQEEHGEPPEAGWEPWPPSRGPVARQTIEVATTPDVDVERLTDRVIKAIDRRVVAYRERTGRM